MNATTRDTFRAIRRTYRIVKRLPASTGTVEDGQTVIQARNAAFAALRNATGHWDNCEPINRRSLWEMGGIALHKGGKGGSVWRPYVSPTARQFFRRTR